MGQSVMNGGAGTACTEDIDLDAAIKGSNPSCVPHAACPQPSV